MDQLNALVQFLRDEGAVITGAPVLSLGLIALGGVIGFLVPRHLYEARLSAKDATIEQLRVALEHHQHSADKPLRPTIEGFEAAKRAAAEKIESWRAMVAFANHLAGQPAESRTPVP